MVRQKILIYLQNEIECFEFFISHSSFWYNQIYKLSRIYNENEHRVYNKIYTNKWWWKQQKKHPPQATIISILISKSKTVISLSHEN